MFFGTFNYQHDVILAILKIPCIPLGKVHLLDYLEISILALDLKKRMVSYYTVLL